MDQERLKVLKMVEAGKMSADAAAALLDALDEASVPRDNVRTGRTEHDASSRALRLRIIDQASGRARVNVCIPVGIAHVVRSLVPPQEMAKLEKHGFDLNAILNAVDGDITGTIFKAEDEEAGVHIEISIE